MYASCWAETKHLHWLVDTWEVLVGVVKLLGGSFHPCWSFLTDDTTIILDMSAEVCASPRFTVDEKALWLSGYTDIVTGII